MLFATYAWDWWCFCGGLLFMQFLHLILGRLDKNYIEMKAQPENRTPMCIRGRFYYVVPESEYIEMRKYYWLHENIRSGYLQREIDEQG